MKNAIQKLTASAILLVCNLSVAFDPASAVKLPPTRVIQYTNSSGSGVQAVWNVIEGTNLWSMSMATGPAQKWRSWGWTNCYIQPQILKTKTP